MSSIILCEGADDAFVLGAYFEKKLGFTRNNTVKFSKSFQINKGELNKNANIYVKDSTQVGILNVKGKDRFPMAKELLTKAQRYPSDESVSHLFLVMDRDSFTMEEKLEEIRALFLNFYPESEVTSPLRNNESTSLYYSLRSQICFIGCTPVVIPFDEEGALETILMNVIKEGSEEGGYVVREANGFVDKLLESENLTSLLRKEREKLKARFSTTLSITNPEHSISTYVSLLESCQWELSPVVAENFRVFDQFFLQ